MWILELKLWLEAAGEVREDEDKKLKDKIIGELKCERDHHRQERKDLENVSFSQLTIFIEIASAPMRFQLIVIIYFVMHSAYRTYDLRIEWLIITIIKNSFEKLNINY